MDSFPFSWVRDSLLRNLITTGLCLAATVGISHAQDGLKIINDPAGGRIVYGPVVGQTTLQGAMGIMLRTVHQNFGDRPQIGRFFQARGSDSVATFFTLTAKSNGGRQVAGLVIVSMPPGAKPTGAVLYDDAQRFASTESGMMKKLNEVWHPEGAQQASATTGAGPRDGSGSGAAAALHQTPFPDNSGSVGLPDGWHITGGYQGQVHAEGPRGEQIHFGVTIPIMDPTNPQQRQMIQMETQGGRLPLPGSYVAYPPGGDPIRALVAIGQQMAQKYRTPVPTFHFTSTKGLGQSPSGYCTLALGDLDRHDGKGVLATASTICVTPPMNGLWMMILYQANAPAQLAVEESATFEAIAMSYKLNNQVIQGETQATIDQIHKIGADSMRRAAESNAAFDKRNAALAAEEDSRDKRNQGFSNYILDQTVVQDNERGERATVYNQYADSLVKADPNRFQYVPTQDFLKGIDY